MRLIILCTLALLVSACSPQTVYVVVTATPKPTETPNAAGAAVATSLAVPTKAPTPVSTETPVPTNTIAPTVTPKPTATDAPTATRVPSTSTPLPLPTAKPVTGCPQGCVSPPPGCNIKGNISVDSGAKIYHVPGGKYYDSTVIDPKYGERWFCTEAEALANGWRKSSQ